MEIRNTSEDLKALLGVSSPSPSPAQPLRSEIASERNALERDRATLSGAGAEVSLSAANDAVRVDKVEEVRAALAAGTYQVPAVAVATKLVDAMLYVRSEK
jgi:flagellar biosynthesis anti-sigma factor FlgM